MRKLSAFAMGVMLTSSAAAASPELAPSLTLGMGSHLGRSHQSDDSGFAAGLHLGAELQIWRLIVGGTVGADAYPDVGRASLHATTSAAHAGLSVPVYRPSLRHVLEVRAAVEIGRHAYSPSGGRSDLVGLSGTRTFTGPSRSVRFAGARVGLSYTAVGFESARTGLVFVLEAQGRRDRDTVELHYDERSCGGLFRKPTDCSTSSGMFAAGGQEVSLVLSAGFVIGR